MAGRKKKKSPLDFSQDAVMGDYASSSALIKKKIGKDALHQFFSPNCVPVGLTDEQVAIIVLLYEIRKGHSTAYWNMIRKRALDAGAEEVIAELHTASRPLQLPRELMPDKVMTDAVFKRGLYQFLVQASTMI